MYGLSEQISNSEYASLILLTVHNELQASKLLKGALVSQQNSTICVNETSVLITTFQSVSLLEKVRNKAENELTSRNRNYIFLMQMGFQCKLLIVVIQ